MKAKDQGQVWRGVVAKVSKVDSGGNMDILFDIVDNETGKVIYPGLSVTGSPEGIIKRAQMIAAELRLKKEQAEAIKVGDEFEV